MRLSRLKRQRHNINMSKEPVHVVAAIFYRFTENKVPLVALFRRARHISGAGKWEFPGGKVDPGESEEQALAREIQEELNIQIKVEEKVAENIHDYGNKVIRLVAFLVSQKVVTEQFQFRLSDHDQFSWFAQDQIDKQTLSPADVPFVELLFKKLRQK